MHVVGVGYIIPLEQPRFWRRSLSLFVWHGNKNCFNIVSLIGIVYLSIENQRPRHIDISWYFQDQRNSEIVSIPLPTHLTNNQQPTPTNRFSNCMYESHNHWNESSTSWNRSQFLVYGYLKWVWPFPSRSENPLVLAWRVSSRHHSTQFASRFSSPIILRLRELHHACPLDFWAVIAKISECV